MKNKYAPWCMAAAVPFALTSVIAQTQPQAATSAPDVSAYTLKVPAAPASQITPKDYELSGTTISGSSGASDTILTAPVGDAAAYKTESGVYLYPSAFVGMGFNDNLQTSSTDPIGSSLISTAPSLIAEFKYKGDRYTALASANYINYASSSADNTTNTEIRVAGDNYFTARARGAWSLGQVRSTDPRGANNRPISNEPDRWTSNNLEGRFIYGAPEAQGRFEFDLGNQAKTYDNNRLNTAVSDVTVAAYAARMFYRIGTRSLALAEYRNSTASYPSALSTDDNKEQRYYIGLTWDATAATTGIVKVGRMTKDFDAPGREGFGGESWEGSVRWMPLTYSAVDLQTSRSSADATGFGLYTINTSTNVIWNHKWSQSLSSRASYGLLKTDFGGTTRSDSANNFALSADYAVLRWLKVGIDWAGTDSTSTLSSAAYKRNVTMFTLNASL